MYIFIAIVGLALLIIFHELGHLLAARALGIHAERISLFFGPAIFKCVHKGIEIRIGTIPLGGYVRLLGWRHPEGTELRYLAQKAYSEVEILSLLDALDLAKDFTQIQRCTENIATWIEAHPAEAPLQPRLDKALTRLTTSISPHSWWAASPYKRIIVLVAGPSVNLVLAFVLMMGTFMAGGAGGTPSTTVQRVMGHSAAAKVGLKAGDNILAINNHSTNIVRLRSAIERHKEMTLVVLRQGNLRTINHLRPRKTPDGWKIGVVFKAQSVYYGPGQAASKTIGLLTGTTSATANASIKASQGQTGDFVSPIGIVRISASSMQADPRAYIGVLALISFSLGLVNLLPIPPLDGGYVALNFLEALGKRRISTNIEIALILAGMGLLLMMLLAGLQNDL